MTILTTLARLPRPYSIGEGALLCKEAEQQGFTRAQWQEVASKELELNGNSSYLAFKSVVTGYAAVFVFGTIAIATWFQDVPDAVAMRFFIAAIVVATAGFFLAGWGKREKLRSALAAAVLRVKAAGMTNDQISVLKDDPRLKNDRDTLRFLDSIKTAPAATTTV